MINQKLSFAGIGDMAPSEVAMLRVTRLRQSLGRAARHFNWATKILLAGMHRCRSGEFDVRN
jgi:hypothetical protein